MMSLRVFVHHASDSQNVARAADAVAREVADKQSAPVPVTERLSAKALPRQIPLEKSGVDNIARGFPNNEDLGLSLNEDEIAAQHFATLGSADVQSAFRKWMRPEDMIRASQ